MSSFNKVIMVGRVTREPELRYTPNGKPVVKFGLAVDRRVGSSRGEKETDFFDIVAWQKLAEICSQYLAKGSLIAVDGRLQTRSYTTQDGQKRKAYEIVANDMRMLGPKPAVVEVAETEAASGAPESENVLDESALDEIPF